MTNALLGGWQVNGVLTFQGGFPATIAAQDTSGLNGDVYGERVNVIGSPYPAGFHKNAQHWFNNTTPMTNGASNDNCLGNDQYLNGVAFCNPSVPNPNFTPGNPANGPQFFTGGAYGNSSRNMLRAPGINNLDSSIFKNVNLLDRYNVQLRMETFNTFNHVQLGQPSEFLENQNFGRITSARIPGRIVQMGAKFIF